MVAASEARNWTILETLPDLILYVRRTQAQPPALFVEPIGVGRHARLPLGRLPGQLLPPNIDGLLARLAAESKEEGVHRIVAGTIERQTTREIGASGDQEYLRRAKGVNLSHGCCPECFGQAAADLGPAARGTGGAAAADTPEAAS